MIPIVRRAPGLRSLAHRRWHSSASKAVTDRGSDRSPAQSHQPLTGSAKLLAEALEEEGAINSSRTDLRHTQGPIWEGEESTHDAVLRMLMDAHKPLRTGEGVRHDTADKKIKSMLKGLDMEPRMPSALVDGENMTAATTEEGPNPHRTTIPPHLHRPWHSTYTGANQSTDTPQVKYGTFIKRKADGDSLTNLLELQLPPGADGKMRAKVRDARRSTKATRRYDQAREGAIDYRLGLGTDGGQVVEFEEMEMEMDEDDETFKGNRQVRGNSVLGAGKGNASGMKAWGGLVEDRIQRARGKAIA